MSFFFSEQINEPMCLLSQEYVYFDCFICLHQDKHIVPVGDEACYH